MFRATAAELLNSTQAFDQVSGVARLYISLCSCTRAFQGPALFREWMKVVDGMSTGKRAGLLWMDTMGLQELLRSTLQRALTVLCMVLEVAAHERLVGSLASLQDLVRRLSSQPVALAPFAAFLRTLADVQDGGGGITGEVEVIQVWLLPGTIWWWYPGARCRYWRPRMCSSQICRRWLQLARQLHVRERGCTR